MSALYVAVGGWFAGIWYASVWDGVPLAYLAGALVACSALILGRADRRLLLLSGFVLALCLGGARMDRALSGNLGRVEGAAPINLTGVVVEQRSGGAYVLSVEQPERGTVLLRTRPGSKLRPGDLVDVRGQAAEGSQLEPYERGLASAVGADLVLREPSVELLDTDRLGPVAGTLARIRARLSLLIERHLSREHAAVAEGLLLGGSLRVDRETKDAFRDSGISHLLAASGYNVTLFAGMLLAVLRPMLGRRRSLPAAFVAIFVYAGLAGFSASVVRAALMGGVGVLGMWLGRPKDSSRALAAAAFIMTVWNPHALHDVGAQLSFVATIGLVWLYPLLERLLGRLWRPLREAMAVALTAQLATLPLGLYYFGGLSVWAPIANVIVAPLVPASMLLSALTIVAGTAWYPLGEAMGVLTGQLVGTITGVAQLVSYLPGSALDTERVSTVPVILYYAALILAVLLPGRLRRPLLLNSGS